MSEDEEITASLAAALPKGEHNGLSPYARLFADYPRKIRPALVLLDCTESKLKHGDGSQVAKVRIRRIELILNADDAKVLQRILERAFETRTGAVTLPFDLEADVKAAFDDVDATDPDEVRLVTMEQEEKRLAAQEEAERADQVINVDDLDDAAEVPDDASELFCDGSNGDIPQEYPEQDPTAGPWDNG